MPIAEIVGVEKHFLQRGHAPIRAVDGVSFAIRKGETFALVGESGCGKTTTAELILLLQPLSGGDILFHGRSIAKLGGAARKALRRRLQVVFQNPRSSLNPRMRIGDILDEPFSAHPGTKGDRAELLRQVRLDPHLISRFPHEISGGQAQRVAIARALALGPELLVLDEPTSALDVSVQAQVINLLKDLQAERGITYLFISHDLRIVRHLSDRVAIMYLGRIVEQGRTASIFGAPKHPYTQALLSAVPRAHPRLRRDRIVLAGDIPSPSAIPSGCRFCTRCFRAAAICVEQEPPLRETDPGHLSACHFS